MALEGVRNFLASRVLKDAKVYKIDDFKMDSPEITKLKKFAKTFKIRPEIEISVTKPFDFQKRLESQTKKLKLKFSSETPSKIHKYKIKRYLKQDVKIHKFSLAKKILTKKFLKQVQALPQERKNLLKFQKAKPKVANNEMILAWYWPIVDGAVEKIVLNKQNGSLLVWYKSTSRQNKARGVYLIRRLGMSEKPEWRWV